jgi:hypothetical protein
MSECLAICSEYTVIELALGCARVEENHTEATAHYYYCYCYYYYCYNFKNMAIIVVILIIIIIISILFFGIVMITSCGCRNLWRRSSR